MLWASFGSHWRMWRAAAAAAVVAAGVAARRCWLDSSKWLLDKHGQPRLLDADEGGQRERQRAKEDHKAAFLGCLKAVSS